MAALIIIAAGLYYIYRNMQGVNPVMTSNMDLSYATGKAKHIYIRGKDSITARMNSFKGKVNLKQSEKDSSYHFTASDSSHSLIINLRHDAGGNLSMDYTLGIISKDLLRIDTIFQSRVDTLRITERILDKDDPPFYNTFLFGAVITGAIILLLISLVR